MILKQLSVKNFRNYSFANINLSSKINIFFGQNAQGKTNLLESIYFLSFTKSHRSFIDNTLIKNGEKNLKITGILKNNSPFKTKLEIVLENDKKDIFVDGDLYKKVGDYITKLNIIIFYPDDLDIIKGSPNIRRRYLNSEISQYDSNYLILLNKFRKIQKMRNDYLKKICINNNYDEQYFSVINDYYIDSSLKIFVIRNKFIKDLNDIIENIFFDLTGLTGFRIEYKNSFNLNNFNIEEIKDIFKEKLNNIFDSEIRVGSSLVGPHKDDIEFFLNELNLKSYGSQGQQRLAVLTIKLAEIEILKKYNSETPILLLDDVFSELDDEKKNRLLKYISKGIQTIITTTDLKNIDKKIKKRSKLFEIENGNIKRVMEEEKDGE
ncbi:MAG: DNA replication/repair protein RecF [Bacilli bacterium]|nr:DNA replication/repair protein RecF [Bacilli bacterium]